MVIGERFTKNGKTYEVTQVNPWGYGYKQVKEEVFAPTFDSKKVETSEVFPVEEEVKKPVTRRKRTVK